MWAAAVASLCCRAKIAVPVMIAVASVFTLHVLNWMAEFQPTISDTLPFTNHHATALYAIIVPPGNAYDFEGQMEPLDVVLDTVYSSIHGVPLSRRSNNNNNNMPEDSEDDSEIPMPPSSVLLSDTGDTTTEAPEVYRRFYDMTVDAAETFAMNASDTTTAIASPIQCSFQLYHLLYDDENGQPLPPDENDMWTARGVLVHAADFAQVQQIVQELNNNDEQHTTTAFPPLQAINFGPGPFAHGSHPIVSDSIVVSLLEAYWVEMLIGMHWDTFGEQDKFVVLRVEVVTESTLTDPTAEGPEVVGMHQHIIMKSDSLDTYEVIYPNKA